MRGLSLAAALAVAFTAACEDTSYRDIGSEISLLTKRDDAFVPPAIKRLAAYGPRAIPQIETALHTASPTGKPPPSLSGTLTTPSATPARSRPRSGSWRATRTAAAS